MTRKQRIFVLYTGGTIGMSQSSQGLRPDVALVGKALQPFSDGLQFDWHVCTPLIDSSALTLQNWCDWLALLVEKIPHYDGVLVLHGTRIGDVVKLITSIAEQRQSAGAGFARPG